MDRFKVTAKVSVHLLSESEGGRKSGVASGYSPILWLDDKAVDPSRLCFDGGEGVAPGGEAEATLEFLTPRNYEVSYAPGMRFRLSEAMRVVGEGKILSIVRSEEFPS